MRRWVLASPELGVYLGSAFGLGFWSRLDPVGQDAACTFETEQEALRFASTWESGAARGIAALEVDADLEGGLAASMDSLERAGIDRWDPGPGASSRSTVRATAEPSLAGTRRRP